MAWWRPAVPAAWLRWLRLRGRVSFDVDLGDPAQPGGEVPVPVAEELHARRDEHGADDRGVDEEGDGDAEAHLLEHDQVAGGEAAEDGDDDQRGAGDQPRGRADAEGDSTRGVTGLRVALLDPAQQEHLVVHREAEEDGEEEERHPRLDVSHLLEAEELVADAFLEDEHQQSVSGADRE